MDISVVPDTSIPKTPQRRYSNKFATPIVRPKTKQRQTEKLVNPETEKYTYNLRSQVKKLGHKVHAQKEVGRTKRRKREAKWYQYEQQNGK
jgi:hypothetical protein